MPELRKAVKEAVNRGQRYPVERLLKSRHLEGYQVDFVRAVLVKKEYTVEEAKQALDAAGLKGGN